MTNNTVLLNAVRTVGIIKPIFNAVTVNFEPPRLNVFGTGFWLDGYFVTCAHVVGDIYGKDPQEVGILVVGGNAKPYRKAKTIIIDELHDIAVLEIQSLNSDDLGVLKAESEAGLTLHAGALQVGQEIAYAGFPLGMQLLNEKHSPSYAEGVIGSEVLEQNQGRKTVQISGPVIGGYSGSPIVLRSAPNEVVSIVSHSPSVEAGQASIFRGIHAKHIGQIVELAKS